MRAIARCACDAAGMAGVLPCPARCSFLESLAVLLCPATLVAVAEAIGPWDWQDWHNGRCVTVFSASNYKATLTRTTHSRRSSCSVPECAHCMQGHKGNWGGCLEFFVGASDGALEYVVHEYMAPALDDVRDDERAWCQDIAQVRPSHAPRPMRA